MSFPSPAEGYLEPNLDLNQLLVERPASTFFFRDASGDILVVDRALQARRGKLVIAIMDGELKKHRIASREPLEVWGVVKAIIRLI